MGVYKFALRMMNIFASECIFYFISIIISIALIFNCLNVVTMSNFIGMNETQNRILTGIPFFLALIICLFTFYANSYFVINKTKEMAIEALCGVSERKLSNYLLLQNLIIELSGFVIGLVIGIMIQPITLTLVYKSLNSNGNIWSLNMTSIGGTVAILIIQLLYVTAGDYAFISTKEIKDLMVLEKEIYAPDNRTIRFPGFMYVIIYFMPVVILFKVSGKTTDLLSVYVICSLISINGILQFYIPKKIANIKEKRFSDNKIMMISLSNLQYSFKKLNFLMLMISSIIAFVLGLLGSFADNQYIKIMSVIAYFSIVILISISLIYKLRIEVQKRKDSFRNLLLIGYTKAEVKKIILVEVLIFYVIAITIPLGHILFYIYTFLLGGIISISVAIALPATYALMFTATGLIAYQSYKNMIIKDK